MKIKFTIEEDDIVKEVCLTTTPIEYLVISSALKQFEENPNNVEIDIMTAKQMRIDICNRAESEKEMPESYDRDYFKEAIQYWKRNMSRFHYKNYTSMLTIWTHVRCLIFTYYGVHALTQMKPEWKEEANKKAIDILRLVERNE